jgi:N-ethylmaleimide reductase
MTMASTSLFDPFQLGPITLTNRLVMAPLTRNRSPGAIPTALAATYYAQRAHPQHGAGLIVTEATAISHQGQGYSDVPGIWTTEQIAGWRTVANAVHAAGGRIFMQLWHVGRISHVDLQPGGQAPVAPSAIPANTKTVLIREGVAQFVPTSAPRALELGEIPDIVSEYALAAQNAIDAGMDGVELHAANGYLCDQFHRRNSNARTDTYGGSIENRCRFTLEVMQAIADRIGGARTALRISPVTPANDAFDDAPQPLFEHLARGLGAIRGSDGRGIAYVHVIEGSTGMAHDFTQGELPFDYAALQTAFRQAGGTAAWMVNNCYTSEMAHAAVQNGADLVCFGRNFIANPDLTRRLREGAPLNKPDRATLYGGGAKGYTDYPALP